MSKSYQGLYADFKVAVEDTTTSPTIFSKMFGDPSKISSFAVSYLEKDQKPTAGGVKKIKEYYSSLDSRRTDALHLKQAIDNYDHPKPDPAILEEARQTMKAQNRAASWAEASPAGQAKIAASKEAKIARIKAEEQAVAAAKAAKVARIKAEASATLGKPVAKQVSPAQGHSKAK